MQDEQARRVLRHQEPIEVKNGVPTLRPGYRVYNYYGIRRANARIDEMFRRSQRYGDITDSEEQMLSGDPVTGAVIDMDPDDFADMTGATVGRMLEEDMIFNTVEEAAASMPDFLRLIREGKVGQVPDDVLDNFLAASAGGYSSVIVDNVLRAIAIPLRIPSMLARWRMVGKAAYPIVNFGATGLLAMLNQGPALALSVRSTMSLSRPTRVRLLQEVGTGIAELTDVPAITGTSRITRFQAKEQEAFRRTMQFLSKPESRVRLTQLDNELSRVGYRNEADVVRLLDLVDQGDPQATALLNQVGRWAEDAVVRFRGMSRAEQFIVRDAIFVYGWLRAAARFTLQFPLNRPLTAGVLYHVGQYGWEQLQNEFYALAWEQQGGIPIGQRKTADGFLRKIIDSSQVFPFKSGLDLLRPFFQIMGLQDTGLRPASFADLLSPSADFAVRAVFGQDPRYSTDFWAGLKYDVDPRNFPGVFWASRLWDPSLTGTKLRADRDRAGILLNFFFGMAAPYEVKQSESYERWLNQQPTDLRTLIREQNDATQLAELGEAAYRQSGGSLTAEQIRAINADAGNEIFGSLLESKMRREQKNSDLRLTPMQRAAVKARTMQHFYPDAYEQALAQTGDLDLANPDDQELWIETWDDEWDIVVGDELTDLREDIEETFGFKPPDRSKIPWSRKRRDLKWLTGAPATAIERIQKRIKREGIDPSNETFVYPLIEEEMLRAVRP